MSVSAYIWRRMRAVSITTGRPWSQVLEVRGRLDVRHGVPQSCAAGFRIEEHRLREAPQQGMRSGRFAHPERAVQPDDQTSDASHAYFNEHAHAAALRNRSGASRRTSSANPSPRSSNRDNLASNAATHSPAAHATWRSSSVHCRPAACSYATRN